MVSKVKGILEEALDLPAKARAELAGHLILSLHPEAAPDVDAAWAGEIDRRLDSFDSVKTRSVPWTRVKKSIMKAQRARVRRKTAS
jgi:putative addiction module component (TIGR02574 family)